MPNQQLLDYVQSQLKLGVTREVIKEALVGAGWQQKDVDDVMGSVANTVAAAVSPAASASVSPSVSAGPQTATPAFKVSEITFQPKTPGVAQKQEEKKSDAAKGAAAVQPVAASSLSRAKSRWLLPAILAVLVVAGAAASVFFYVRLLEVQTALDRVNADAAALSAQIGKIAKERDDLKTKLAVSVAEVADMGDILLLFVSPSGATTAEVSLAASGTLSGGDGKNPYVVTTARGVKITLKNGKAPQIEPVLKSLVGMTVEVSVTHVPGSSQATLVTLNGKGFAPAPSTPASEKNNP